MHASSDLKSCCTNNRRNVLQLIVLIRLRISRHRLLLGWRCRPSSSWTARAQPQMTSRISCQPCGQRLCEHTNMRSRCMKYMVKTARARLAVRCPTVSARDVTRPHGECVLTKRGTFSGNVAVRQLETSPFMNLNVFYWVSLEL